MEASSCVSTGSASAGPLLRHCSLQLHGKTHQFIRYILARVVVEELSQLLAEQILARRDVAAVVARLEPLSLWSGVVMGRSDRIFRIKVLRRKTSGQLEVNGPHA